jgi:hypothetical protein
MVQLNWEKKVGERARKGNMDLDLLKDHEHIVRHMLSEGMIKRSPFPTQDWFTTSLASN